ncbi:MAG: hypothetical protein H8E87_00190 [FCB group bacterium]|nr:hypothetical protein [FCB group bacterium]
MVNVKRLSLPLINKNTIAYALTILFLALSGCEEEDWKTENFSGITVTTVDGTVISADYDDWDGQDDIPYFQNVPPLPPGYSKISGFEPDTSIITDPVAQIPEQYSIYPAFPNPSWFVPFNISFSLPQASNVHIWIINSNGDEVSQIAEGMYPAGAFLFRFDPEGLAPGLYRVLMETGSYRGRGDILVKPQITDPDAEYIDFMQAHWNEELYYSYIDSAYGSITEEEFGLYNLSESGLFSYRELIGKSNQFVSGWDDFIADTTYQTFGSSAHQAEYLDLWVAVHGE